MREHPQRYALVNELHARPHLDLAGAARASYYAVVRDEDPRADLGHLVAYCRRHGLPLPPDDAKHFSARHGDVVLKWESHTEFTSYLFVRDGPAAPFTERVIDRVPPDWWQATPGELLVAVHLEVLGEDAPEPDEDALARWFERDTLCSAKIHAGRGAVWTDFRVHADGAARILVRNAGMSPQQAGRAVQRLAELETYRALALLALPLAQDASPRIRQVDLRLAALTARLDDLAGVEDQRGALHELSRLSAEIEQLAASTAYRFGATAAYHALVKERLEGVREAHIAGRPSLAEFIDRRLLPAIRTCNSVAARGEGVARRLSRGLNLLRTQVDVAVEAQNRDLLASMNRRARLQLRLQETVEGLSIAAITYYVVGLVGYLAKAVHRFWPPLSVPLAQAAAVPVVAAFLWWALRRVRAGGGEREE
jgi:uncharacterized membrane-anchored protein